MPYDDGWFADFQAPRRIRVLLYEGYDLCAASAILNQRKTGRGIVFLGYDMTIEKVVSYWIARNNIYEPEIREMFSAPAWQSLRQITGNYDMRFFFCVVIPDQIDDIFYTLRLPYTAITPKMNNKELQAVLDAVPKQYTKGNQPSVN